MGTEIGKGAWEYEWVHVRFFEVFGEKRAS